jgi:hypothetical protein
MNKWILPIIALAASSSPAFAAGNTDTQQGSATATIVAPITLTHTSGAALNFGNVTGGSPAADAFSVTGDPSRTFTITTTSSTIASSGGATLNFTTSPSAVTGTMSGSGAAAFTVGGTLTVPNTATAAVYSGSYNATVTYN